MKFLVDAQLPRRLARWLHAEGHEAIHTSDLPEANQTGDATINCTMLARLLNVGCALRTAKMVQRLHPTGTGPFLASAADPLWNTKVRV